MEAKQEAQQQVSEDIEMALISEISKNAEPSKNATDVSEMQTSKFTERSEVKAHEEVKNFYCEDIKMNYNQGEELSRNAWSKIEVPSVLKIKASEPIMYQDFYSEDMEMALISENSKNAEPSENATDVSEMQTSKFTERSEVKAHEEGKNLKLLKIAYDLIKHNSAESENDILLQKSPVGNTVLHIEALHGNDNWLENITEKDILQQKSPMGNTVLHIAALYGNDNWLEKITENASHWLEKISENASPLLAVKNANGDTALHVAARAGHISTLKKLLVAGLHNLQRPYSEKPKEALGEILLKNTQGNTFFHEAILNGHKDIMTVLGSQELQIEAGFKELVERAALFWTNNEGKSVLHLAIEKGYEEIVVHALTKLTSQNPALDKLIQNHQGLAEMIPHATLAGKSPLPKQNQGREMKQQQDSISMDTLTPLAKMAFVDLENRSPESSMDRLTGNHQESAQLIPYGPHYVPPGKSPLIVATLNQDQDILRIILGEKEEWIHLRDNEGRTALHYAASIGYLIGVEELLERCISCNMERDNDGFFPLHLASAGGHTKVVKKLLEHCPDPREILDNYGRNIFHIAAETGKLDLVRYILQDSKHGLVKMINDKDINGNTPLHLATLKCHPKIVHALTWDKRVELSSVNRKNQTALDAHTEFLPENPSLKQRLIWIALKSAGKENAKRRSHSIKVPLPSQETKKEVSKPRSPNMDLYKDRINTLVLVSTLITTVTFAAGFTLPGGTNSSNPGQGMALMLNHVWFKPFIFCITISMYGAVSVTIILIWAQLGEITLALRALKVVVPLLGVTLATLSVAFMAGVHLVISDLSWLATAFLVLCVISIFMLLLLYILLWFPSSSSKPVMRYISYYPFQYLSWVAEKDTPEGM